jgi:hypothetical protein
MIYIPNRVDDQRPFLLRLGVKLFRELFEAGIAFGSRLSDRKSISECQDGNHRQERQQ